MSSPLPPDPSQPPYGGQSPYGQQPYGHAPYGQLPSGGQPSYGAPSSYGTAPGAPPPPIRPGFADIAGTTYRVATMGERFAARLIDGVLTFLVLAAVVAVLALALAPRVNEVEADSVAEVVLVLSIYAVMGLGFLFVVLYEIAFIATRGATLGKRVLKIRVVGERTGLPIGWGLSLARWFIPFIAGTACCGLPGLVVYLSSLWDETERNQGWHDKLAKDFVISTR